MLVKKDTGNDTFAAQYYILYAKFSQILGVLWDFHHLFGSRNGPTTGILRTVRHVYRSVWPAREAKPCFGAALERCVHDYETRLYICMIIVFNTICLWHVESQFL